MLFESLNGEKVPEKSFLERVDEQLTMSETALLEQGVVVTTKTNLKAFMFYRDHAAQRQKAKAEDFKHSTVYVNNQRKRHAVS